MAAKPNIPVSRKEMYLDVATGGSTELPSPVTREEKYLAKIAGESVGIPTPVTRYEMLLAAVAGESYTLTPVTRLEVYLAKAAGQDVEVPQPITREEMYWFDYVNGQPTPSEQEYTGAVPVTFIADGTPLLDYLISGNEEHSGTPTPDNPIMPNDCGDLETAGTKAGQYKIPILSAGQTTPIYLGEVETTRKIKKLVLTGKENWSSYSGVVYLSNVIDYLKTDGIVAICTHYQPQPSVDGVSETTEGHITFSKGSNYRLCVRDNTYTSGNAFKPYLAAQYAAGTPVTVWYVLAEPETAVVNEPLMRIGDYADTLSMEQAGAQIPTANGSTTLDVDTTVKPSEVYIKYKGYPVAGSQTSLQSSAYAPAEVSSQSESIDDINSSLLGKEEET